MKRKRTALIFVLLILIIGALCCGAIYVWSNSLNYNPHDYPRNGLSDFDPEHTGYYKINPETILASLSRGETDVFIPEPATPSAPVFNSTISWHQSDYLKITNAVFQSVWKETFDSWSLLSMVFKIACQDNPDGFESGDIHFFKADGESDYTTREVLITPQYGDVSWGGGGLGSDFSRPSSGWKSIDVSRLKITADDALKIADDNGGKSFRSAKENQCRIAMILQLESDAGWGVIYVGYDGSSNFNIEIDPYTGKVISSKTFIPTAKPLPLIPTLQPSP